MRAFGIYVGKDGVLWYLCRKKWRFYGIYVGKDEGSVVFMQGKMGVLWYLCRKR